MALRQAMASLAGRVSPSLRLAPLAAACTQIMPSLAAQGPAAAGAWAPTLPRFLTAEAVAEREAKLPETTGWGSTRVGSLLKAKVGAGRAAVGLLGFRRGFRPYRAAPRPAGPPGAPTRLCPAPRTLQEEDSGAWLWCAADDMVIDAIRKARACRALGCWPGCLRRSACSRRRDQPAEVGARAAAAGGRRLRALCAALWQPAWQLRRANSNAVDSAAASGAVRRPQLRVHGRTPCCRRRRTRRRCRAHRRAHAPPCSIASSLLCR